MQIPDNIYSNNTKNAKEMNSINFNLMEKSVTLHWYFNFYNPLSHS